MKTIIDIPMTVDVIRCSNPNCGQIFALLALWIANGESKPFECLRQSKCDYCPYCGVKMKEEK